MKAVTKKEGRLNLAPNARLGIRIQFDKMLSEIDHQSSRTRAEWEQKMGMRLDSTMELHTVG